MRRLTCVVGTAVIVSWVGGVSTAAPVATYYFTCTAGPGLSSPITSTLNCTTERISAIGEFDHLITARVIVNGAGLVGGFVQIQRLDEGVPTSVTSASCGAVPLSCEAATTHIQNDFANAGWQAFCAWTGVIAINTTITCEQTVQFFS